MPNVSNKSKAMALLESLERYGGRRMDRSSVEKRLTMSECRPKRGSNSMPSLLFSPPFGIPTLSDTSIEST